MKNALISISLFVIIMTSMFFLNRSIINLCDNIEKKSEELEITLTNGDFEEAYQQSIQLLNLIEQNNFITSIYVNHQDFDTLNDEAVKLSVYTTYKDYAQSHASLHSMKYNAKHIKNLQIPRLENIL